MASQAHISKKINSRTHMYSFMKALRVVCCVTQCLVSRGTVDLIRYTE